MINVKLANGWKVKVFVEFGRRPIHDHSAPRRERMPVPITVPVYNDKGEPILDEDGEQTYMVAKRIKVNRKGRRVYKDGQPVFVTALKRPAPMVEPECTVCHIVMEDPEGESIVYSGWAWFHWKDRLQAKRRQAKKANSTGPVTSGFSREIGFKIAKRQALEQMNLSSFVPPDIRQAISIWASTLLLEHVQKRDRLQQMITATDTTSEADEGTYTEEPDENPEDQDDQFAAEAATHVDTEQHTEPQRVNVETQPVGRIVGGRAK